MTKNKKMYLSIKCIIITLILSISYNSNAQSFQWVKKISTSNSTIGNDLSTGQSIKTDAFGNVYVSGFNSTSYQYFVAKLEPTGNNILWQNNIAPTSGTYLKINLDIDNNNNVIIQYDNTISKFDQNGVNLWTKTSCSGTGTGRTYDFVLDATGNLYITGTFNGTLDFNPSSTTTNFTAQGSSYQLFVVKLDGSGNYLDFYKTSDAQGTAGNWLNLEAQIFDLKCRGTKLFIVGNGINQGIKFSNTSSIIGGPFLLGLSTASLTVDYGNKIGFNCPNLTFAKLAISENPTKLSVITKIESQQVTPIDFDPGVNEALIPVNGINGIIVKIDYGLTGNFIDVKKIIENWAVRISEFSVSYGSSGKLTIGGTFLGTVDFNPQPNNNSDLTAAYFLSAGIPTVGKDLFIASYDINGNIQFARQIGNYNTETLSDLHIVGNTMFATGQFDKDIPLYLPTMPVDFDFDPNNIVNVTAPPRGYVLKVNLCPSNQFISAGPNQTTCQGDQVTLTATGANSYVWTNGVQNNVPFTPASSNTYIVTGTDANGCQSSDTVNVTVLQNSSSQVTQSALDSYTLNGQTYTQSGTYTQVIPNAVGCDSTITLNLTLSFTGLSEVENDRLSIYPNPTTDFINIVYDGEIQLVELVDMKGALFYNNNENKTEHQLPHSIQTGLYTVLIHTDNGIVRKKLIIQN